MQTQIDSAAETILGIEPFERLNQTRFLCKCRENSITKAEMDNYIIQQYFYSTYFTRFLCALMANLSSQEDILKLAENLFDELGISNDGMSHDNLYKDTAAHLDVSLDMQTMLPETKALINSMLIYCKDPNPLKGLAALYFGAEVIVGLIYPQIILGIKSLHYTDKRAWNFFEIHVHCDAEHQRLLHEILIKEINNSKDNLLLTKEVGRDMIQKRIHFFDSITQQ